MENESYLYVALIIFGLLMSVYLLTFVKDRKMLLGLEGKSEHFSNYLTETENYRSAGSVGVGKGIDMSGQVGPADLANQLYGGMEISTAGI